MPRRPVGSSSTWEISCQDVFLPVASSGIAPAGQLPAAATGPLDEVRGSSPVTWLNRSSHHPINRGNSG